MLITRGSTHSYIRRAIQSGAVEARKAIVVGWISKENRHILDRLHQFGIHWAGVLPFHHMQGNAAPGTEAFLTDTRTFVERCRLLKLDDIFFLATPPDLLQIAHLVEALSELPVTVHIIPTGVDRLWSSARIVSFGEALSIQVLRPPLSVFDLAVKRGIDICIAGLSLFACWPFLLMLSVAIKL